MPSRLLLPPRDHTGRHLSVTATTATLNGTVADIAATSCGFYISSVNNPPTSADTIISSVLPGGGLGVYTGSATGLTQGTTYYCLAWATNADGTAVDTGVVTFKTLPAVTTQAITSYNKGAGTATGHGTIIGGAASENGTVWNTTGSPTTSSTKVTSATHTGAYTTSLTGLPATIFFYRSYAINSAGTSYGAQMMQNVRGSGPGSYDYYYGY